jgi:hypothetical protein
MKINDGEREPTPSENEINFRQTPDEEASEHPFYGYDVELAFR